MKKFKTTLQLLSLFVIFSLSNFVHAKSYDHYASYYDHDSSTYTHLDEFEDYQMDNNHKKDIFKPINQFIFSFNMSMDTVFLEPLTNMYKYGMPDQGKVIIDNFLSNLGEPISFVNNILQGKGQDAGNSFSRFFINTIFGFGGLFDVAKELNIKYKKNTFAMTLSSWGVPEGPYLVIPILGPSTVRNFAGTVVDAYIDPIDSAKYKRSRDFKKFKNAVRLLKLLNFRYKFDRVFTTIKYDSLDQYVALRAMYLDSIKNPK